MNKNFVKKDWFGFLAVKCKLDFDGGSISTLPRYDEILKNLKKRINEDGFLYPHVVSTRRLDTGRVIPKTKKPVPIFSLPPSHELEIFVDSPIENIREHRAPFIIHLLAYIFGTRLQFHDWWVDKKIPVLEKARTHNISISKKTTEDFISHCYQTWLKWDIETQKHITNILYMLSRAPSYQWDWEQFSLEYMVFDGCWKIAKNKYSLKAKNHEDRLKQVCKYYNIPYEDEVINKISTLRNDLFHETLWDKGQPSTQSSGEAFIAPIRLRSLNQRIVPALFGYKNVYVQSSWCSLGTCSFDKL